MFKIAIIGSGPSGLCAAAHASELGAPQVLLKTEQHAAEAIDNYQIGMAEPNVAGLRQRWPDRRGAAGIVGAFPRLHQPDHA